MLYKAHLRHGMFFGFVPHVLRSVRNMPTASSRFRFLKMEAVAKMSLPSAHIESSMLQVVAARPKTDMQISSHLLRKAKEPDLGLSGCPAPTQLENDWGNSVVQDEKPIPRLGC